MGTGGGSGAEARAAGGDCAAAGAGATLGSGVKPAEVAAVGGGVTARAGTTLGSAVSSVERWKLWLVMVSVVLGDSGEDASKLLECGNSTIARWRGRRSGRRVLKSGGGLERWRRSRAAVEDTVGMAS